MIAVVTGTSTGIGYETALTLARTGLQVFATMRQPSRSPELARVAQEEALPLTVVTLDVDSDASVSEGLRAIEEAAGRIDVLVNNAGVGPIGPVEEMDISVFREVMETNYFGVLRCVQAVLPGMRVRRTGCIVNVSSVAGRVATSPQAAYAASKFAMEALSEILAQEVRQFGIRVAIVEPGVIKTPIFDKAREAPEGSVYPQERRLRATYAAAFEHPVSPAIVAEQIRKIVTGDGWQLRYPVGPDARPLFAWRRMMSDEEWVERNAEPSDEAWAARIKSESGVDMLPYLQQASSPRPET